jgi:hypothetical protein
MLDALKRKVSGVYAHLLESSADAARQRLDAFGNRSGQEMATIARNSAARHSR